MAISNEIIKVKMSYFISKRHLKTIIIIKAVTRINSVLTINLIFALNRLKYFTCFNIILISSAQIGGEVVCKDIELLY